MKKIVVWLLILALLCTTAMAGTKMTRVNAFSGDYAVVNNPDPLDKLHLRSIPSRDGKSLGKYYNGVLVKILEKTDDHWFKVQVGQTVGYMMTDFLADPCGMEVAVEPVLPIATVCNPFAPCQGLLEKPDNVDVTLIVTLDNGTEVTVLGTTDQRAHVQYCGMTGYIPLQSLTMEENQGFGSVMPVPQLPEKNLVRATLVGGESVVSLTEKQKLQTLQEILIHTEYRGYKMAGCPFTVTLTLEYDNHQVQVMELATDSCPIYRLDGHDYSYARHIGTEGNHPDNHVLYDLFGWTVTIP